MLTMVDDANGNVPKHKYDAKKHAVSKNRFLNLALVAITALGTYVITTNDIDIDIYIYIRQPRQHSIHNQFNSG